MIKVFIIIFNMENLFSKLDLLAPSVQLSYNRKRTQGTMLGGCCSSLMTIVILYYIASSLFALEGKKNYYVNYEITPQFVNRTSP